MTPTERDLIRKLEEQEKKDIEFRLLKYQVGQIVTSKFLEYNEGKFHAAIDLNPIAHVLTEFISREMKREHDKARNQAINDCIATIERAHDDGMIYTPHLIREFKSLKTIS